MITNDPPIDYGDLVVIGYGKESHCDGAVGHEIAKLVSRWNRPGIRTYFRDQLTPDLAEVLNGAHVAIFVTARPSSSASTVQARIVEPSFPLPFMAQSDDPHVLLALTQATYGRYPYSWWITVPAINFEMGKGLSSIAQEGISTALERIQVLVEESACLPV
jgi:Ni,Fe-hydrogenase maturation factor